MSSKPQAPASQTPLRPPKSSAVPPAPTFEEAQTQPAMLEASAIRRIYDDATEIWRFSAGDIIQVLTQQADYQTARKYWNKLKERLGKEGSESVTNCRRLKLPAADGKRYLTDVATAETLLRLGAVCPQPEGRADQAVAGQSGLRANAGDGRPGLARVRNTWQQHGRGWN